MTRGNTLDEEADALLEAISRRGFLSALGRGAAAIGLAGPAILAAHGPAKDAGEWIISGQSWPPMMGQYYYADGSDPKRVYTTWDRAGAKVFRSQKEVDAFLKSVGAEAKDLVVEPLASRQKTKERVQSVEVTPRSRFDYAGGSEDAGYSGYAVEDKEVIRLILTVLLEDDPWHPGWRPTRDMLVWFYSLIMRLNEKSRWGMPGTGQEYAVDKRAKTFTLIKGSPNDPNHWHDKNRVTLGLLGFQVLDYPPAQTWPTAEPDSAGELSFAESIVDYLLR